MHALRNVEGCEGGLPECAGMSVEREQLTNGRWSSRNRSDKLSHSHDECDQSERADGRKVLRGSNRSVATSYEGAE